MGRIKLEMVRSRKILDATNNIDLKAVVEGLRQKQAKRRKDNSNLCPNRFILGVSTEDHNVNCINCNGVDYENCATYKGEGYMMNKEKRVDRRGSKLK